MPRKAARHGRQARRPVIVPITRAVVLLTLLGGCDAIYDDTKGWANRLEASFLKTMHEMGEPAPEETAPADGQAMATAKPASEAPPAVPVTPVDTAALPKPPKSPEQTPALSGPHEPDGLMAEAAGGLMAPATVEPTVEKPAKEPQPQMAEAAKPPEAAPPAPTDPKVAALPPKPVPKPERKPAASKATAAAQADVHEKPAGEKPAETAKALDEAKAASNADVAMVLHLSSLRSEDAAKREWSDLQRSFPDTLGQMHAEIRRAELGDKGVYYRVLAGPLPSRKAADQTCANLKAKDARQYCRVMPSQPQS